MSPSYVLIYLDWQYIAVNLYQNYWQISNLCLRHFLFCWHIDRKICQTLIKTKRNNQPVQLQISSFSPSLHQIFSKWMSLGPVHMVKKGHKYVTLWQINVPTRVMVLSQKLGYFIDKGTFHLLDSERHFVWDGGSFIWQGGHLFDRKGHLLWEG